MTVGLITPNEGRIFLDDLEITKYPVYKRAQTGIGYLAQEASVFRQMSVEDNIASVLEIACKKYAKTKVTNYPEVNAAARKSPVALLSTRNSSCSTNLLPVSTRSP